MQTYYFRVCIANAFVKGERELHFMFHFVILSKKHHAWKDRNIILPPGRAVIVFIIQRWLDGHLGR